MAWNPEVYNQFKAKRYEPFYDLIGHVRFQPGMIMLDLGCGTGEQTRIIAARSAGFTVSGIDSSSEMLGAALSENLNPGGQQDYRIHFAIRSVEEQLHLDEHFDLKIC